MYSNEELQKIIRYESIGDLFPYEGGNDSDIENYIKSVVADLNRSTNIIAEADYDMYGSGYASYVDVFCYRKDGSSTSRKSYGVTIEGISLYICRLAPVSIYGYSKITRHSHGGSSEFLSFDRVNTLPLGDWIEFIEEIVRKVHKYNISILDKEYLTSPLPFDAKIPTILGDAPYKIFDAFFYWED